MTDFAPLIARLEAAPEPDRTLFYDVYEVVFGKGDTGSPRWWRFCAMLNAEAWESAAIMLVRENCEWGMSKQSASAFGTVAEKLYQPPSYTEKHRHPAIALLRAALKARAAMRETVS